PRPRRARRGRRRRAERQHVADPRDSRRRTLPVADVRDIRTGLVVVDVELWAHVGSGEVVELLQGGADGSRAAVATEPRRKVLARLALVVEPSHETHDGFRRVLRGNLRGLVAELDLGLTEVATEEHLVSGRGATVRAALEAEEPDVADVVLTAAI